MTAVSAAVAVHLNTVLYANAVAAAITHTVVLYPSATFKHTPWNALVASGPTLVMPPYMLSLSVSNS
jgi:hypothetical protein